MALRDLLILLTCCLAWAGNFTLIAWAAGDNDVPPLLLAAVRALIVMVVMSPFLFRPRPRLFRRMLIVAVFIGPLHLIFLYSGLTEASASAGSIVSQMLIPMSAVLAIVFLKERVGWRRSLAIAGAFGGTMVMLWDTESLRLDIYLLIILVAYLWIAIGSIIMRTLGEIDWRVYVAWTSVLISLVMVPGTLVFEGDPLETISSKSVPLFVSAIYAALAVSVFAHGQYFRLLTRYPVNQVIPITLMVPVFTVVIALFAFQVVPEQRALIGAALILPSVYVIAKRDRSAEAANEFD